MKLFFLMETPMVQKYKVFTQVESKGIAKNSYYKEEEIEVSLQETVVRGTVVKILRRQISMNELTPSSAIEREFDILCRDFLNDLELVISEEGKIVAIENYTYLYIRWEDYLIDRVKNTMQYCEDEHLREMDNIISDKVLLLNFLHSDLFLYFFFHIYGYYPYNPVIRNREIPDFLGNSFWIKEQLEYVETQRSNIDISIEGNLSNNEEYLKQSENFFHSKGITDIEFRGKYEVSLDKIPLNIDIMLETKPNQELFYKCIHLSIKRI